MENYIDRKNKEYASEEMVEMPTNMIYYFLAK